MRKALAILALLAAAFCAAPVLAQTTPTVDVAAWVKTNTDLPVAQVAITGPENVYSLEPLGPRLPTGEVLALVRTEAVSNGWRAAHRFQSWDAHMLFDCQGARVRVLRSTSYLERDRRGEAKPDEAGDGWLAPPPKTPVATLLAAACDPHFNWPLRAASAETPVAPAETAEPPVQTKVAVAAPPAADKPFDHARTSKRPPPPTVEKAASPDMAQFAAPASARAPSAWIQKASFTPPATLHAEASAPKEEVAAPRAPGVMSKALAATRACERIARTGGGWLWRRVEVAFHRNGPGGVIRQTQLS